MTVTCFSRPALFALAILLIAGCGGGGSSSASQANAPIAGAPVDRTGVVGIIIKDAPAGTYTRIMMRITSVELLGNGNPHVVFDGDLEFDLLSLRNHSDLLALSDVVPVGDYNKIRLRIETITLYSIDANGDEVSVDVRVPANGKVDLNPRGSFTVAANSAVLIQIDLDANKSIHVVQTGNGSYRFRPVVFVDIDEHEIPQGLVRVSGEVGTIQTGSESFDLCSLDVHLTSDSDDCIRVNVDQDTSLFNADGVPIEFADLEEDEPVTLFARAVVVPAGDDDSIRIVQLAAIVVHEGMPDSILSLDGTAADAPDADDLFPFEVAAGQELPEQTIDIQLLDSTRILSGDDLSDLETNAIDARTPAEVSGTLQPDDAEHRQYLNAALVVIDNDSEDPIGQTELTGTIQSLDTESFVLFAVNEDPPGDRCVAPLAHAHYIVVVESDEGTDHNEVDASYLDVGLIATVFGAYADGGDCFEADVILIEEE